MAIEEFSDPQLQLIYSSIPKRSAMRYNVRRFMPSSSAARLRYRRYLGHKSISYTGFDLNQRFIRNLVQSGVSAEVRDLRSEESLPANDYVIMQASLYHFLPDPEGVLQRMRVAARKALIISEPILNLADSKSALVRQFSGRLTNAGNGSEPHRFNEQSLDDLFSVLGWEPESAFSISGGREKVFVFAKD